MKNLEDDNITGRNSSGKESNKPLKRLTVSSIIGDNIFNTQGESLGQIKDMMIDITTGAIEYVVIEFGGFIGINRKYLAVPFHDISVDANHHHSFILNETLESLKKYPGFDKDHWPGTNSHVLSSRFSNYGGFMGANTGAEY
jgi:sporulation protein YlmC with PRC-barrel domain